MPAGRVRRSPACTALGGWRVDGRRTYVPHRKWLVAMVLHCTAQSIWNSAWCLHETSCVNGACMHALYLTYLWMMQRRGYMSCGHRSPLVRVCWVKPLERGSQVQVLYSPQSRADWGCPRPAIAIWKYHCPSYG